MGPTGVQRKPFEDRSGIAISQTWHHFFGIIKVTAKYRRRNAERGERAQKKFPHCLSSQ
jgi:hypothetical protein